MLILSPWRWRRYDLPKRRLTFNGLQGVTSQKIEIFTLRPYKQVTSLKTATLKFYVVLKICYYVSKLTLQVPSVEESIHKNCYMRHHGACFGIKPNLHSQHFEEICYPHLLALSRFLRIIYPRKTSSSDIIKWLLGTVPIKTGISRVGDWKICGSNGENHR
jgi:hypothetical protein